MKKRSLSLFLALALCAGLIVPAFAFDCPDTYQEAYKDVTLSYHLKDGVYGGFGSGVWVEKEWDALLYDFDEDYDTVEVNETGEGYYALPSGAEFTLTFNDSKVGDNSYILIYVVPFVNYGDGTYEWSEWPHSLYLTNDGTFLSDYMDPESYGGLVELKAGESVKFTLPSVYEYGDYDPDLDDYPATEITDVVYRLRLEKWYPDTEHEETDEDGYTYPVMSYFWRHDIFKADDAAVAGGLSNVAYATTQTVLLDGKSVEFQTYALKDSNGNLTNYIKLRDLAYHLNGTAAQFSVDWQPGKGITLTSGQAYTPNGSELSTPFSGNQLYGDSDAKTVVNGQAMDLDAITLDNGSFTYYKLRDLGKALGFNVSYINRQIVISTNEPYDDK